jgi:hypothetical protein
MFIFNILLYLCATIIFATGLLTLLWAFTIVTNVCDSLIIGDKLIKRNDSTRKFLFYRRILISIAALYKLFYLGFKLLLMKYQFWQRSRNSTLVVQVEKKISEWQFQDTFAVENLINSMGDRAQALRMLLNTKIRTLNFFDTDIIDLNSICMQVWYSHKDKKYWCRLFIDRARDLSYAIAHLFPLNFESCETLKYAWANIIDDKAERDISNHSKQEIVNFLSKEDIIISQDLLQLVFAYVH